MRFRIVFILLFLFSLTNFPITIFHLMDKASHSFTSDFSFPKITAKSDTHDIILSDRILDEVHLDNLKDRMIS